jgi:hypothetical protein
MARYGASVISEMTQRSGSLTRLASDLGQARQEVLLFDTFQGSFYQRPPRFLPPNDKRTTMPAASYPLQAPHISLSLGRYQLTDL